MQIIQIIKYSSCKPNIHFEYFCNFPEGKKLQILLNFYNEVPHTHTATEHEDEQLLIQKRNLDTIFAYTINCFLYRANITFYFRIRAVKRKFLLCAWIIIFYQLARSKIVYYILVILQRYTPSNFRHEPLWYCPLTYCKMH